eukprot:TRINITY_DN5557_c0_g1_i1.p1 TRINITY_DN5557_c0_g1~~TRINITY_DN5557_c0_g1_i1.p1  ORF type:complete len:263 (-),score=41.35 TRINITY_DN5557_c0_g1_i1:437-1225(-)
MATIYDAKVSLVTYKSVNRVRPGDFTVCLEDRTVSFKPLPENCDVYGMSYDEIPPVVKVRDIVKLESRDHVDATGRYTVYGVLLHQERGAEVVSLTYTTREARDIWLSALTQATQAKEDHGHDAESLGPPPDRPVSMEEDTVLLAVPDDADADGKATEETTGLLSAVGGFASSVADAANSAVDAASSVDAQVPERHVYCEILSLAVQNSGPHAVAAFELELRQEHHLRKTMERLEVTKADLADLKGAVVKFASWRFFCGRPR